jgi:hypothetical protein
VGNTTDAKTPRQRKKPECFVKLVRQGECLFMTIREVLSKKREKIDAYDLLEIGADTGRGFRLTKADGAVYHVNVGSKPETCECRGHLQWGHKTVCRHRAALRKLIAEGRL